MSRKLSIALAGIGALASMSCSDAMRPAAEGSAAPAQFEQRIECTADVRSSAVRCGDLAPSAGASSHDIILGNQGGFVKLTSSNVQVNGQVFAFDVTVQNKLAQAIGTTDGVNVSSSGIRVFFASGPTVTGGTGTMDFANPSNGGLPMYDGLATFTASNQPYYVYNQMLLPGWTSAGKQWRLRFDPGVQTFSFTLLVSAPVQLEQGYVTGHPHVVTLAQGEAKAIGGTVVTGAGTPIPGRTITYTSSDPALAAVDASGIVTGGAAIGLASITLQSGPAPGAYATSVNVCPTIPTIASGASIVGTITTTDCFASTGTDGSPSTSVRADIFHITLTAGQQISATLAIAVGTQGLALVDPTGTLEAAAVGPTAKIKAIAQKTGAYTVEPYAESVGSPLDYTLDVSVSAPSVSIVSVTQSGMPVNLSAAAGAFTVSVSSAGPGTIDVFLAPSANCGTSAIAVGDSLLASKAQPNPFATTSQIGVDPSALNTSSSPKFLNGAYCLKARLTTVGGAIFSPVTAVTLANVSRYVGVIAFTKTTALGLKYASSPVFPYLRYDQGDLVVTVTPVDYSGTVTIASLSLTLGGAAKTLVLTPAPGTQTFTGIFGSSAGTPPGSSIDQYQTTDPSGDALTVTSATSNTAQPVSFTPAVGSVRIDNKSPNALVLLNGGNGLPTSNWINGSLYFTSAVQNGGGGDQFATTILNGTRANDASFVALPGGVSTSDADCSQAGWTMAYVASALPNTAVGSPPNTYRLRQFEYDPLGNIRCTDMPNPFGLDKDSPTFTIDSPANFSVITSGTMINTTPFDALSGLVPGSDVYYHVFADFTTCVYGDLNNSCRVLDGTTLSIDNGTGTQGYYYVMARALDVAGNQSPNDTRVYLLDSTAPAVGGITIPQNLTGGGSTVFTSTASDNVDLRSSNFDIQYSALTGLDLFQQADDYGPNFDQSLVKNATVNAAVSSFIQQIQSTNGAGVPIPLGADKGEATSINVRAVDAAKLQSPASSAALPFLAQSTGFTQGVEFDNFTIASGAQSVNNGTGTALTSVSLVSNAILFGAAAQSAPTPFAQVCYYYQQTATGNLANPAIPTGVYVQIGCVPSPSITDFAGVSRTFTYTLSSFDPPAALGTSGAVSIIAIGMKSTGVGIVAPISTNITLTQ